MRTSGAGELRWLDAGALGTQVGDRSCGANICSQYNFSGAPINECYSPRIELRESSIDSSWHTDASMGVVPEEPMPTQTDEMATNLSNFGSARAVAFPW